MASLTSKQQLHAARNSAPSARRAPAPVAAARYSSAHTFQPFTAQPQRLPFQKERQQQQWHASTVVVRSSDAVEIPPEEVDFDLLSNKIADIQVELVKELNGCSIFLIGMMGSGKSTLGRMLANTLKYAFFDTDDVIEMAHKPQTVSEIFGAYGEDYFRQSETQVLKELSPYKNLVVSTGGGAVKNPINWSYMHAGVVVWLDGPPELLARRVTKDGVDKRPLLLAAAQEVPVEQQLEATTAKISGLLDERRKFYTNADITVPLGGHADDTDMGAPTPVVMYRTMQAMLKRIQDTKAEREARMNFTINYGSDVPSMKVVDSPAAQQQQEQQQEQPEQ